MTIFGILFVVLIVTVIVVTEYVVVKWFVRARVSKMDVLIEKRAFEHISLMRKFPDDPMRVRYFVPKKRTLWDKLVGKYTLHLFTYCYMTQRSHDDPIKEEASKFSVRVTSTEYFMLHLKGQANTDDRAAAMIAYEHFADQNRLGKAIGLP